MTEAVTDSSLWLQVLLAALTSDLQPDTVLSLADMLELKQRGQTRMWLSLFHKYLHKTPQNYFFFKIQYTIINCVENNIQLNMFFTV